MLLNLKIHVYFFFNLSVILSLECKASFLLPVVLLIPIVKLLVSISAVP